MSCKIFRSGLLWDASIAATIMLLCACNHQLNPSGCAALITRQPLPLITVAAGQSVTFSVTAIGEPTPSYQWRKNGVDISNFSDSLILSSVQLSDSGTYSVVVCNRYQCDTSNGAVLRVISATAPAGMVTIPRGTFQMGDTDTIFLYAQPVHQVTISAFYMDTIEVTRADYSTLMGVNPSFFAGDTLRPVENLTWYDAVLYCNARSKRDMLDTVYDFYGKIYYTPGDGCYIEGVSTEFSKNGYRLPTEAEWEYAYRAGSTTDYYWGRNYPPATTADTAAMDDNAVWWHNSNDSTARVGIRLSNVWGLHDMSGNVEEWCNDPYEWYPNPSYSQIDPTGGPDYYVLKVVRGGAYRYADLGMCAAYRGQGDARYGYRNRGFRCVRR